MKTFILVLALVASATLIVWAGTPIPGTVVAAKITTGNTDNTFSIGDTIEMLGTCKEVADLTARDAIPAERRAEGMQCWVVANSTAYRLIGGIANANWQVQPPVGLPANAYGLLSNDGSGNLSWTNVVFVNEISVTYITNNTAYVTNLFVSYVTNNTSYTTNLFVSYVTNNTAYITNLFSTYLTNSVSYITNLNLFTTVNNFASNYIAGVDTMATNANNTTPDFAVMGSTLSTNNNFKWLPPTHLDTTGKAEQWIITHVTNSLGTLITMTAPDNVHVCGGGAMNVTNWTEVRWQYYPPSGPTNMWPSPGY